MKPLSGIFTLSYHKVNSPQQKDHLDLFLQLAPGHKLLTFHLPLDNDPEPDPIQRGADHRARYLTFEGNISPNLGSIQILKQGVFIASPELLEKNWKGEIKITCHKTGGFDITNNMWKRAEFRHNLESIQLFEIVSEESLPEPVQPPPVQEPEVTIANPQEMLLESFLQGKTLRNRYSAHREKEKIDAATLAQLLKESASAAHDATPVQSATTEPSQPTPREAAPAHPTPPTGEQPAEYLEVPEMILEADGKSDKGYEK